MKLKGFTLIELLVVIAIISMLSAIVLASLSSARTKASLAAGKTFSSQVDSVEGDQAVAFWNFDQCTGSIALDTSGSNNTATLIGAPTWSTDTPFGTGCSLSFDTSGSQYVAVPDNDALDIRTGSATRALWFKTTMTTRGIMFRKSDSNNVNGMIIDIGNASPGQLRCYIDITGHDASDTSTSSYNDGQWHFVTCVLDRSSNLLNLYVDGTLKASSDASGFAGIDMNSSASLLIGGVSPNFNGLIDNVHLFSKNLVATQIQNIYAREKSQFSVAMISK